jgi:hypothetical protein
VRPVWAEFPQHWGDVPPLRYGTPHEAGDVGRRGAWIREQEDADSVAAGYRPGTGARLTGRAALRVTEARRIDPSLDPRRALDELDRRAWPPSAGQAVDGLDAEGFAPVARPAEVGRAAYRCWGGRV